MMQHTPHPPCPIHPRVELLHAPPNTDLVLAATRDRSLVAWQHDPAGAHR